MTTLLTGVVVAAFAAWFPVDEIVDLTNIGTLFAFVIVACGVLVLRVVEPDRGASSAAPAVLADRPAEGSRLALRTAWRSGEAVWT